MTMPPTARPDASPVRQEKVTEEDAARTASPAKERAAETAASAETHADVEMEEATVPSSPQSAGPEEPAMDAEATAGAA